MAARPASGGAGRLLRRAWLGAAVLALVSCGGPSRAPGPDVVLISIDTLRQDHVSAYGYSRPTTPSLDRLAAEGARFTDAWSPTSWTLPAHMSVFTGLTPSAHEVEGQNDRLPEGVPTLAEAFQRNGYATAAFVSHDYLDAQYGFARGFDHYVSRPLQRADEVTHQALAWLGEHRAKPLFLFLHYFDPHADYEPPDGYAQRFDPAYTGPEVGKYTFLRGFEDPAVPLPPEVEAHIVALYDGEIRYTDEQIGHVVDFLRERGTLDDTIVAVFSDHGEEFKEHGSLGHGGTLYAEVTRVPLVVRYAKRIPEATRVDAPTLITDLPALLTGLAAIPSGGGFSVAEAAGALEELTGGASHRGTDRRLVLETTREGPKRFAVIEKGFAYVSPSRYVRLEAEIGPDGKRVGVRQNWIPIPEALYRLADDPYQQTNLLASGAAQHGGDSTSTDLLRVLDASRSAVGRYVREQSRGVRLVCNEEAAARYEGTVRFADPVLDEPYGWGLSEDDRVAPLDRNSGRLMADYYGIELTMSGSEKGVVFVPAARDRRVFVSLLRDGHPYFSGAVPVPEAGSVSQLGSRAGAPGCHLEGGAQAASGQRGQVALTQEQLERLRSLGYVP